MLTVSCDHTSMRFIKSPLLRGNIFYSLSLLRFFRRLPSAFTGKRSRRQFVNKTAPKRPRIEYDRDIVCLPKSMGLSKGNIPIPRSSAVREMLAKNGLIGKIHLVSTMNEEAIMQEIRSVFSNAMQNNEEFAFQILPRAYREKRACNAILSVKTSKSLLLLRIALSVINYCYGIRRVNGI